MVERRILPEDVKDFEECFVTNSLMGIMPVTALGEVEFQSRKVTESWMAKRFCMLTSESFVSSPRSIWRIESPPALHTLKRRQDKAVFD